MLRPKISPPGRMLVLALSIVSVVGLLPISSIFAQGNRLFVSATEFTASSNPPRFVGEVNLSNQTVTQLFSVPSPRPENSDRDDKARDLIVDESGNVLLFNGTSTPSLLSGNAVDGIVSQNFLDNSFGVVDNRAFGGIDRRGDFVFLTDQLTRRGGEQGIVRVDLNDNSLVRFAEEIQPLDLTVTGEEVLTLDGFEFSRSLVYRYDLQTLELVDTIPIEFKDHRGIASAGDGTFFTTTTNGDIFQYDFEGTELNSVNLTSDFNIDLEGAVLGDIDIAADGQIAIGTAVTGQVFLTNTSLDSVERIQILDLPLGGDVFVAFATDFTAVPEPSSGLFLVSITMILTVRRTRCS